MLIELQKKLVYSIIKQYSTVETKEDLFQVGMVGAITAYQKYDSSTGVKYSTFAYKYILGEVLKYLRENRTIKLNKILNMSKERIDEVLLYNKDATSLNKLIIPDEELTIEDMISNNDMNMEDRVGLNDALASLNAEERKLIYDRYYKELTQTDIAKENNTTQVKVYRLERKILDKLKDKMA